jgi:hypothetical protein
MRSLLLVKPSQLISVRPRMAHHADYYLWSAAKGECLEADPPGFVQLARRAIERLVLGAAISGYGVQEDRPMLPHGL